MVWSSGADKQQPEVGSILSTSKPALPKITTGSIPILLILIKLQGVKTCSPELSG